jgi:hypothetical protein
MERLRACGCVKLLGVMMIRVHRIGQEPLGGHARSAVAVANQQADSLREVDTQAVGGLTG